MNRTNESSTQSDRSNVRRRACICTPHLYQSFEKIRMLVESYLQHAKGAPLPQGEFYATWLATGHFYFL